MSARRVSPPTCSLLHAHSKATTDTQSLHPAPYAPYLHVPTHCCACTGCYLDAAPSTRIHAYTPPNVHAYTAPHLHAHTARHVDHAPPLPDLSKALCYRILLAAHLVCGLDAKAADSAAFSAPSPPLYAAFSALSPRLYAAFTALSLLHCSLSSVLI
jgi:hypothetical protein